MKKLLLVVDFQVDFVDGTLGFEGASALEGPICDKIEQYRSQGAQIAFTLDTHEENYLNTQEGSRLPVKHCLRGSKGHELYGSIARYCDTTTPCFQKPTFGCIALQEYVRREQFELVEVCGLVSNICVISNAILLKAALPEARIVVDARCTGSFDPVLHEKSLDVMAGLQIDVIGRDK